MNALYTAALELQRACEALGVAFYFIGGLAVARWGEPRFTRDADVVLVTGFGREAEYVDRLLGSFAPRISDARSFACENRVLLLANRAGVPLDVALGGTPFEERAANRASNWAVDDGMCIRTCSAEDLIVFKVFAGRAKDWLDVDGILARRATGLDAALIFRELEPLLVLKEDHTSMQRLRREIDVARGDV